MIYSVQEIKFEFLAFIKEKGGDFSDWYIGIAADPVSTLTAQHQIDQSEDAWIYKQALTFQACRTVQRFFQDKLNMDGETLLRGNEDTDCVYLFKKSERTSP